MTFRLRSFFLLVLVLVPFLHVSAVQALTVSPVKLELTGDPGQTLTGTFDLYNEQAQATTFYVSTANFEAEGETGTPKFVESAEGLASWITVEAGREVVTLDTDQTQTVNYQVTIPSDADPGGYFAAIFWGTSPETSEYEKQLSLGAKVGILMLLTVSGEVDLEGGLLEFDTQDSQRVFTEVPVGFYYRFQNAGSDRILPTGTVDLYNTLGIQTDSIVANEAEGNILPSSIRRFEETWGAASSEEVDGFWSHVRAQWQNFAFGYYKADLHLSYDGPQSYEKASVGFWVIPWQLILVVTLTTLFALGSLRIAVLRYNKWIIASALGAQKKPQNKKKSKSKKKTV